MWLTDFLGPRGRRRGHHLPDRGQAATSPTSRRRGDGHNARERDTGERRAAGAERRGQPCRIAAKRLTLTGAVAAILWLPAARGPWPAVCTSRILVGGQVPYAGATGHFHP